MCLGYLESQRKMIKKDEGEKRLELCEIIAVFAVKRCMCINDTVPKISWLRMQMSHHAFV